MISDRTRLCQSSECQSRLLKKIYWYSDSFLGMKTLWIFFEGHHNIGPYLGVVSNICILGSFLKVKVKNGRYFFRLVKFQIFFDVFKIPDICFWDEG